MSALAVVSAVGFHPFVFFVTNSHRIFLSFDVKYIEFVSYGLITEEIFFMALTQAGARSILRWRPWRLLHR